MYVISMKSKRASMSSLIGSTALCLFFFEQAQAQNDEQEVRARIDADRYLGRMEHERNESITNIIANESKDNVEKGKHALWVQVGLGLASARINHQLEGTFLHGEVSMHFRRHNKIIAGGIDAEGKEAWGIGTIWGSYGLSGHASDAEVFLSVGAGVSSWSYNTESSRRVIRSQWAPCFLARAQAIVHLPQVLGLGFFFVGNINRESSYAAAGLVVALGVWNF